LPEKEVRLLGTNLPPKLGLQQVRMYIQRDYVVKVTGQCKHAGNARWHPLILP